MSDFNRGYVLACCNLVNLHDEPCLAFDTLAELGVTRAEVKAMDLSSYDLRALRKIEKARKCDKLYRDGRSRAGRAALAKSREAE